MVKQILKFKNMMKNKNVWNLLLNLIVAVASAIAGVIGGANM
jgi:hypothetical protein